MIRMILIVSIIPFSIQRTIPLTVNELKEFQKTVDVKVEANTDDYEVDEINKLAMPDETEHDKLKRLKRQLETLAASPPKSNPVQQKAAGASTLRETVDEKIEADGDDYKMEELNKLAVPDETENTRFKRSERLAQIEEPTKAPPARIDSGMPAASTSNLPASSFQKHIAVLGITLSTLYKMNKYLCA